MSAQHAAILRSTQTGSTSDRKPGHPGLASAIAAPGVGDFPSLEPFFAVAAQHVGFRKARERFLFRIEFPRQKQVVGVEQGDEFTAGDLQPGVAGARDSLVCLIAIGNEVRVSGAEPGGIVGRAIIDEHDLHGVPRLRRDALYHLGKIARPIVGRNNDAETRRFHGLEATLIVQRTRARRACTAAPACARAESRPGRNGASPPTLATRGR